MGAEGTLRQIASALRRYFTRHIAQRIELVAWRPLHAGAVLYVADFDRRRHAFVVGPHAACSLASYAMEDVTDGVDQAGREATGVEAGSV
jgi:hypothetical protein